MNNIYKADLTKSTKENTYYSLAMFPYPSGAGLHVGHGSNFTANDIIARFKRMQGYTVINPMGWDSFGLPTENYAMKLGKPASEVTEENIAFYKTQCELMDWSYDWEREVATSNPSYYKWTQRIFQELYKAGLVYKKDAFVNRCPSCQTVLANDQVIDGRCERCETEIIQKKHPQWFIKITEYAEKLISDLDLVDRPEETKSQQRYWIGKSEGAEIIFSLETGLKNGSAAGDRPQVSKITVFTTRPDTLFGVTALVLAPENTTIDAFITDAQKDAVEEYRKVTSKKTNVERQKDAETKSGVFSGAYAIHPLTQEKIPVRFADYVLMDYATGAVMFVPAHDERDGAFAKKNGLGTKQVIAWEWVGRSFAEDKPIQERHISRVVVKHPSEDKYLIRHTSNDTYKLIGGGLGKNLDKFIESVKKEIQEESGYKNIASIVDTGHKAAYKKYNKRDESDSNLAGVIHIYLAVLADLEQGGIAPEEASLAKPVWMSEKEILAILDKSNFGPIWNTYHTNTSYTGNGILVNSGEFDGLDNVSAKKTITQHLENQGLGKIKTTYKLRDRSVSRQRYWGSPIPVYYTFDDNEEVPFFMYTSGNKAFRPGLPITPRKVVQCIVKDTKSDEYCFIKRAHDNDVSIMMGGIDGDEDMVVAAKRELLEEAGLKDLSLVNHLGEFQVQFYHPTKNRNQYSTNQVLYFETDKSKQGKPTDDEAKSLHQTVWMKADAFLATTHNDTSVFCMNWLLTGEHGIKLKTPRYHAYNPHPNKDKRVPHLIPTEELPVILPLDLGNYKPQGKSPLADHATFPYYAPGISQEKIPFFRGKDDREPKKDMPIIPRSVVTTIIKHPLEDKYLFLKRNNSYGLAFVTGGIEGDENIVTTAIREIGEETGYTNVRFLKELCETHSMFFAHHKNENRYMMQTTMLMQLEDMTQVQQSLEKHDNFELIWLAPEEVDETLMLPNNLYIRQAYISGKSSKSPELIDKYNDCNPLPTVPYFDYHDEIRGIREGIETKKRNIAQAVVVDPATGKYLALKWKVDDSVSFVAGGIEEGENAIECMIREIREETGYTDVKYIKHLGSYQANFYHPLKGHNQYSFGEVLYFELQSQKKDILDAKELEKHEPCRMTKEEFLASSNEPVNDYFIGVLEEKIPEHKTWISASNCDISSRALLFHGRGNNNDDGSCLHGLQKALLKDGYAIEYNTYDFEKVNPADTYSENAHASVVAGHSTGAYLALKYAQHHKVDTLMLISPLVATGEMPEYLTKMASIDFKDAFETYKAFHQSPIDHDAVKKNCKHIIFVFGSQDKIIGEEIMGHYKSIYTNAEFVVLNQGHMGTSLDYEGVPELGELIIQPRSAGTYTYLRECDTLDTFMCSSFYYLRFVDPYNTQELISKELSEKALPVDFYIGGKEHTYGHLLYARFIHKFLFDRGYLTCPEPFQRLFHQGMILGPDGRKMSKRRGNIITPEDMVNKYGREMGADVLRTYTMFMGPLEVEKPWNDKAVEGVKKFLDRVVRLEGMIGNQDDAETTIQLHKAIKGIGEDIEKLKFNTAVSKMMVFVNFVYDKKSISKDQLASFLQLLAPFATKLSQEMRVRLGREGSIHLSKWPVYDDSLLADDTLSLPVQILGKTRGTLDVKKGITQEEVMKLIAADEKLQKYIDGKEIKKIIYVQDKIVNIVM